MHEYVSRAMTAPGQPYLAWALQRLRLPQSAKLLLMAQGQDLGTVMRHSDNQQLKAGAQVSTAAG